MTRCLDRHNDVASRAASVHVWKGKMRHALEVAAPAEPRLREGLLLWTELRKLTHVRWNDTPRRLAVVRA